MSRSRAKATPAVDLRAAEAELARRCFGEFVRQAWPVVETGGQLVGGWYVDVIAEHLEAVGRGEIRRLVINIPPRHGKSLLASVLWPAWTWTWTWAPSRRFLYASYAHTLATRDSVRCRRLIESSWYRQRWGATVRLTDDQNLKNRFENSRGGSRIATSVGGSATGEGGDVLVCDDPHKIEEASSEPLRESVLEWWDTTMSTRLNDPRSGGMVVIMQRLHERDLSGHLLAQGGWEHLCLPAEYEPNHPFCFPRDPRTTRGEPLAPGRFEVEDLARLRRSLGSYAAAGQLQQLPAPSDGGIFRRAWWQYYDPAAAQRFDRIVQSWDLAFKGGRGSDYVVGQVWGRRGPDAYLLRQVRERVEFTETLELLRQTSSWVNGRFPMHRGHPVLIEDRANGPAVISVLRREVPGVIAVAPQGDKVARARAVSPQVEAANVHLPGRANSAGTDYDRTWTPAWVQEFVDELAAFPRAAHDDQVDAFSQGMMRFLRSASRPRVRVLWQPPPRARRRRLLGA